MIRLFCLMFLAMTSLYAQAVRGTFVYQKSTTLAASAETVTLHLPSNAGSRLVRLVGASVYCSVACTVTMSRDGTAPTNTAGTAVKLNSTDATAIAVPYHTSNVGASTTIKTYTLSAGEELAVELDLKGLKPGENLTLATNSITGDARIFVQWQEQ